MFIVMEWKQMVKLTREGDFSNGGGISSDVIHAVWHHPYRAFGITFGIKQFEIKTFLVILSTITPWADTGDSSVL